MGIRLKILFAFLLCFGLMAGVGLNLLKRSVDQSYDAIERGDVAATMARVERSFEASATSLQSQTSDWAVWNEMYRYALKPDADWAKENIGEEALAPADISMAVVLGKDGRVLTVNTSRHQGKRLDVRTPAMRAYLDRIAKDGQQAQCGMLASDAGLMLTCWAGIVQSNASGEIVGTVVMGRLLDASRLQKLREQTRSPFALTEQAALPEGLSPWPGRLEPGVIGNGDFWASSDAQLYHLAYPLQDILGQKVGLITLDVARSVHQQGVLLYQQVRQQLVWTVLIVTALLGLALHFLLIRRLRRLARQIDVLEKQSDWEARIDVGGADELGLVATKFNALLALIKSQVCGLNELLAAKESAIKQIKATQAQLVVSEQAARLGRQRVGNLLDNSGEGFMSFGSDLVIDPEVSRACDVLLGCSAAGHNVAQVLAGADAARADLIGEIIHAVLAEPDAGVQDSMLSLLPTEISRQERWLKADYKRLENDRFMVVLTDITEQRRLQAMLQSERQRLEFIVAAVSDSRSFFDAIDGFREFMAHSLAPRIIDSSTPQNLARWLYRRVHTYKGLLNQFSFIHTPAVLHAMESRLSEVLAHGDALSAQEIVDIVSLQRLQGPFADDLSILGTALGQDFMDNGKNICLSSEQARQLETLAERLLRGETVAATSQEMRHFLNEIAGLRKLSFAAVLKGYDSLVQQAAKRLGKKVAAIDVAGGAELWLDPQAYQAFFHALGHVFRNAVVHGLETPEGRWSADKDEAGKITCQLALENDTVKLSIADDGAGIDLDALRRRALESGLHAEEEIRALPDEECARLIFREKISTLDTVTDLAGRGVGLSALRVEVEKLGGTVEVRTVAGKGTQFLFSLPWRQEESGPGTVPAVPETPSDEPELVMRSLIAKARDYFESEHATALREQATGAGKVNALELLDLTAVIGIGGKLGLQVAFSFQDSLADAVYAWMTAGFNDAPDAVEKHRQAAAGEVANTVLGHCTIDLQHLDRHGIRMTPPLILGRTERFPAPDTTAFRKTHLETALGRLDIIVAGPANLLSTASD